MFEGGYDNGILSFFNCVSVRCHGIMGSFRIPGYFGDPRGIVANEVAEKDEILETLIRDAARVRRLRQAF